MVASKTSFVVAAVALGAASVYAAPTPFNAGSDLVARGFEDDDFQLEARFFDDDELEARNFEEAEELFARHFEDEEALYARDFFDDDEELFARDADDVAPPKPKKLDVDTPKPKKLDVDTPKPKKLDVDTPTKPPKTKTKTPAYDADDSRPSRPKSGKPHNENAHPAHGQHHHQHHHHPHHRHHHHHPHHQKPQREGEYKEPKGSSNGPKKPKSDDVAYPKKVPTTGAGATIKTPKSVSDSVTTPKKALTTIAGNVPPVKPVASTPKAKAELTVAPPKPKRSLSDLWDDIVARDEDGPKRSGRHHRKHRKHHKHHHHHHKRPQYGGDDAKPKGGDADDAAPPVAARDIEDMVILARSLGLDDDYFLEERALDDNMMEY